MSGEAHRDLLFWWKQFKDEHDARTQERCRRELCLSSVIPFSTFLAITLAISATITCGLMHAAAGQTFDEAFSRALTVDAVNNFGEFCFSDLPGCWIIPGSDLEALAEELASNVATGALSATPATASPQAAAGPAIERRLQAVRESEERRREAGLTGVIPASYTGDQVLAANDQVQIPPAGSATPEIVITEARGFSVFVSTGATALNHHNNPFEDGYEAQLPTVTIGADYWVNPRFLARISHRG
jgi:hypothetical protein